MNTLKRNGEYDRLSRQHLEVGVGSGAHSGPGFLPWHREYLKRVEIALRMVDPTVFIPYWDSVMDSYLPDPRDSIMFSDLFVGGTDYYGNVVTGPFAYWRTIEGRSTILRNLGAEGQLFNENQVNTIVAQNTIENTLAYTAPQPGKHLLKIDNALFLLRNQINQKFIRNVALFLVPCNQFFLLPHTFCRCLTTRMLIITEGNTYRMSIPEQLRSNRVFTFEHSSLDRRRHETTEHICKRGMLTLDFI